MLKFTPGFDIVGTPALRAGDLITYVHFSEQLLGVVVQDPHGKAQIFCLDATWTLTELPEAYVGTTYCRWKDVEVHVDPVSITPSDQAVLCLGINSGKLFASISGFLAANLSEGKTVSNSGLISWFSNWAFFDTSTVPPTRIVDSASLLRLKTEAAGDLREDDAL